MKIIVRSPDTLSNDLLQNDNLSVIHASVLDLSDAEMVRHVNGCEAVASYLGHNLSFKGVISTHILVYAAFRVAAVPKYNSAGVFPSSANGFATKYTRADMDRLVDDLSGTSIKTFCQRVLEVHGDQCFSRLASISVSHIYNLRKSKVYQRCRRKFIKTQGVKINIGERCKPLDAMAEK